MNDMGFNERDLKSFDSKKNMKQIGHRSHIFAIFFAALFLWVGSYRVGGKQLVDFFFSERGRGGEPSFTILIHL